MSRIFDVFTDKGEFSWRKIMTGGCLLVFMMAQIGYLITHKYDELPTAYWSVDAGVFAFYFLKKTFEGIKLTSEGNNK
jgi:hypothetical protein